MLILILTKDAGGEGLNLMGASAVIIYTPHLNPARDRQAIGRAFRIG